MAEDKQLFASLATLRGGEVIKLFDAELAAVYANIDDPNTEAESVRSLTLKVTFSPDEERRRVALTIKLTPKLCGAKAQGTMLYLGRIGDVMQATEYNPNQLGLFDEDKKKDDENESGGPTRVTTFKKKGGEA